MKNIITQLNEFGLSNTQFDAAYDKCFSSFEKKYKKNDSSVNAAFDKMMLEEYGFFFELFKECYIQDDTKFLKFKLEWC